MLSIDMLNSNTCRAYIPEQKGNWIEHKRKKKIAKVACTGECHIHPEGITII